MDDDKKFNILPVKKMCFDWLRQKEEIREGQE